MKLVRRLLFLLILCICITFMGGCKEQETSKKSQNEEKIEKQEVKEEVKEEMATEENPAPEEPEVQPEVTPAPSQPEPTPAPTEDVFQPRVSDKTYYIRVNRVANCVTIYAKDENGVHTVPVKAMICSVGRNIYNTPAGVFTTVNKYEWRALYGGHYGQYATRFNGPILFHSVPYVRQSKDTLRADYYNNLGVGDSMGCVRLTCADAKWIYDNCELGTIVEVYDHVNPWHAVLNPPEGDAA